MKLIILFLILSLGGQAQIIRAQPFYMPLESVGTLFLDSFPNAVAAYSLRKLKSSYSGSAIKVRRSSDNTTQDIGFTANGDLDTATMKIFVGANNGFIDTWYDQSGNGRNATQATAANQPRIMLSGVIDRLNNKPTIKWSANTLRLSSYKFAVPSTNWMLINVASINNISGNNNNVLGTDGNGYRTNGIYLQTNVLQVNTTGANFGTSAGSLSNSTQFFISHQYFSTDSAQTYVNNTNGTKISMLMSGNKFTSGDQSVYWIGAYRSSNAFNTTISLLGNIQEHIIYQSDQTNNISGIKNNINNFYKIW